MGGNIARRYEVGWNMLMHLKRSRAAFFSRQEGAEEEDEEEGEEE